MQEFINTLLHAIEKDSMLTLLTIIAIVVVLVILLVLLVSSMRIELYKDRWWNLKVDKQEKAEYISSIERELQSFQMKDATNTQKLLQLSQIRETLKATIDEFTNLQKKFYELSKELTQSQAQLENKKEMKNRLEEEHKTLLSRFDSTVEENMKHRTNNARLLSKIEAESKKGNR